MLSATEALDSTDQLRAWPIITHVSARARDLADHAAERIGTADPRLPRTPRSRARIRGLHYRATCRRCWRFFCASLKYDEDARELPQVQASDLETFVIQASARVGRITMQKVIAIMRSFLRFLAANGQIPIGAGPASRIATPSSGRNGSARALRWEEILSLLRGIDRSTVKGCRDYAMLLLIATLWSSPKRSLRSGY